MANSAEQDPNAKHKYEDVEVFKVDIVGGPATKDKFMVVRSEDEGATPQPRRSAMTKAAVTALRHSDEGIVSLPVVARQEVVDEAIEQSSVDPDKDKKQQPVEREENEPENNSEETMKTKELADKLSKLTGRVERMEQAAANGDFSEILGSADATPEGEEETDPSSAPEGDAAPEQPAEEAEPEATPTPAPAPAPESAPEPAPAPETAPVEPEAVASTPTPAPVETPLEAPAAAPVAPVPATDPAMVDAVGNLTATVERMATAFQSGLASVNKKIDDTLGRVDKVERSVLSGGNAEEGDGTEGPIERGDDGAKKPGLFYNVFHG